MSTNTGNRERNTKRRGRHESVGRRKPRALSMSSRQRGQIQRRTLQEWVQAAPWRQPVCRLDPLMTGFVKAVRRNDGDCAGLGHVKTSSTAHTAPVERTIICRHCLNFTGLLRRYRTRRIRRPPNWRFPPREINGRSRRLRQQSRSRWVNYDIHPLGCSGLVNLLGIRPLACVSHAGDDAEVPMTGSGQSRARRLCLWLVRKSFQMLLGITQRSRDSSCF